MLHNMIIVIFKCENIDEDGKAEWVQSELSSYVMYKLCLSCATEENEINSR